MSRYYYTCPIKALYMMKEFGVKFYTEGFLDIKSDFLEKELGFHLEIRTLYNKLCQVNSKIYVASESEHIFKPRNYDLAGFTRDDGISTIAQYDEVKKAFINGNFRILKKYNPIIIMRDNKQFFMPEVEKKYIAVIDKDFGVIFPDFLGCVSVGDNLDDAKIKAQEVLQFHIQGMREDGEELPNPKSLEEVKKEYPNQFYFMVEIC